MTGPPLAADSSGTPDQGSSWNERDQAMHGLLGALLPSTEGPCGPTGRSTGRHLAAFLEGEVAPVPGTSGRKLKVGEFLGRFRIEAEIGRGGFGVVYRANDTHLGRAVAVKLPRPDRVQNVALWDRFAREARLAGALDHEAIVPVLDAGFLDGILCVISAFQEGETLGRWLATRYPAGTPPPLAARHAATIASALAHAHAHGVLHRDLKPANVLMVPRGAGASDWIPRIVDFGLGTSDADLDSQSGTGFWQGSPPYMAPEQVLPNRGRVDARSDVYALGSLLYEMLSGRTVYACASIHELSIALGGGDPPTRLRHLRPDIPRDVETIVATCLEHDPGRRYASADALLDDLNRFLEGRPILARPLAVPERLGRWVRRKPSHAALVALVLLATTLTVGLIVRHEWQLEAKNVELTRGNDQLKAMVVERNAALDRLQASERRTRRTALAADLRLAERQLAAGHVELVQTLLRRHVLASGRDDLRDFPWLYVMRQATRSYTIHPLRDLAWWRGSPPLAPALRATVPETGEAIRHDLGTIVFDPDGIRFLGNDRSWLLDGKGFLGTRCTIESDRPTGNLEYLDGSDRILLDLPARWHALGPGRRTLAMIESERRAEERDAPPLVRHVPVTLPFQARRLDAGSPPPAPATPPVLQPVGIPRALALGFSGDGRTLGCLAEFHRGDSDLFRPLFYDLRSDWRGSYPEHARPAYVTFSPDVPPPSRDPVPVLLILSHDGRLAALTGDDPRVVVLETRTGEPVWALDELAFGKTAVPISLAFSPNGSTLVTGDSGGAVKVWNARTGVLLKTFPVNVGYVANVGYHPDSHTIAVIARGEDAVRLWNYAPRPEPPALLDHGDEVWGLAFSHSGTTLFSAGDDNTVKAWRLADGALARTMSCESLPSALAASPLGDRIALGKFSGLTSWHRATLDEADQGRFVGLSGTRIRAVVFAPDARTVVAGGNSSRVLVGTGIGEDVQERLIDTPHNDTYGLAFSPDGRTLAMGSHDRVITLWDVPAFRHRATLSARARVACVAYAPDGKTLVSGDIDGGLQFWNMPEGALRTSVDRASETGGIWSLAFSPDGKTLATGGDDRMVRLWDPELAIERLALTGHVAKVHAVAFSPDGQTLASGDFTGRLRLWRTAP